MKALFISFWRKNLGYSHLAIIQQLEYRLNFVVDALVQPFISLIFEALLWIAIFRGSGQSTIAGFPLQNYLAYVIWGTYFARIAANWMYEHRMIDEINSGQVNSLLVRPTSYFEYFLFQFMGYKFIITCFSMFIPVIIISIFGYTTHFERLPLAFLLLFYYLIFTYSLSFLVATGAFYLNKIHAFTFSKNMILMVITGELFPLDLFPPPLKDFVIASPFASGVFVPVGYITGRLDFSHVVTSFISVTLGIVVLGIIGSVMWKRALRQYTGTGA